MDEGGVYYILMQYPRNIEQECAVIYISGAIVDTVINKLAGW